MNAAAPEHAWRKCYRELAPRLLLFARQWVASQADAEDVVQNAFVRFWRKQPCADAEHYPLLFSAVRTAALDWQRGSQRRSQRESRPDAAMWSGDFTLFECPLEQREEGEAVTAALAQLSEVQREVVVLKIWGELTFAQIATTLGESINTVAARYRTGLENLRKVLRYHTYERA